MLGTALVDANGVFSVALSPAQINGQALSVTQSDGINVSPAEPITAPNLSAPAQPADLAVDANGVTLTGTAQAGTTVEARAADGTLVGSGPVDTNGDFSFTLTPPQINGESLELVVTDAGGRTSIPLPYTVADNSDPAAAD